MSAPVNVGDVLAGKYQVERVLGVGGMGVVVAAKHLTLGERVAIKFLLPQALAREDVVTRFRREGQAAARLKSEHITRVIDVGQLESGQPFLVMEYLDGTDLGAIIRAQGPLEIEQAVEYALQACEALADAHSIGIVHRDLKPSNLFVIKRLDGSPSIKLIDFGISKITDPSAEGAAGEMTATAVMMGSPLYMAPEQMASARDVDGRADIWSLGILLHTVLTGTPPFRAPTVMGVYEQIVAGAPPIRKQRPAVPEGLEAVILGCLKKDRRDRYADVGALAEALAPFGPAHGGASAARIKRIIAARRASGSVPPPPDLPLPVATLTPAPSAVEPRSKGTAPSQIATRTGAEPTPISDTQPSAGGSTGVDGVEGTGGPWDQRTGDPPATSRRPPPRAVVAAAVGVALIAAPLAFLALRSGAPSGPAGVISAASAGPVLSAARSAEPSAPEPSAPSVAPAEPTASASAAPPASAAPTASASARPFAPLPGGPRPLPRPPRPRTGDDLFGTQK